MVFQGVVVVAASLVSLAVVVFSVECRVPWAAAASAVVVVLGRLDEVVEVEELSAAAIPPGVEGLSLVVAVPPLLVAPHFHPLPL